jgi:DNA-binding NarL/FixJ family response regulator
MRRRYSFASVVVGKNSLRRDGLAGILSSANFRIVASVSCADDLLPFKTQHRQLLFLIVHTGDDFDAAVEQIELFKERHPDGRVAIVADHYRLNELASAFRAGATGYFVDVMRRDVFIKSVELVMMGETVFPPAFLSMALDTEGEQIDETSPRNGGHRAIHATEDEIGPQLSPRERSILRCLIEGDSNKSIARKIDIAEATVKVHIKAILRKIRVQNRTQAAIWGMNNRWLARPSDNGPEHLSVDLNRPPSKVEPETPEIKRIGSVPPASVISHATNRFDVSRVDGPLRKEVDLKTNGAVRLRK